MHAVVLWRTLTGFEELARGPFQLIRNGDIELAHALCSRISITPTSLYTFWAKNETRNANIRTAQRGSKLLVFQITRLLLHP